MFKVNSIKYLKKMIWTKILKTTVNKWEQSNRAGRIDYLNKNTDK